MGITATVEEAREALRLAEAEPERAVAMSARISEVARRDNDAATAAVAERAWGLALRHGGEGYTLRSFGDAENRAGVLDREKTFRYDHV